LKALGAHAASLTTSMNGPSIRPKSSQDLTDASKWAMGDLSQFKQIMQEVERDLVAWEAAHATCISGLRELESEMMKADMRHEEAERFSRASSDANFARMLKTRALNPDHLETQSKLRRDIRTMRGRVQQLEEYIQVSKKKLNSLKTGKPTLKPPTLDTINRTYRNIDIAIDQEETEVSELVNRVAVLELGAEPLSGLHRSTSSRDKRLPDRGSRVGREVTPNIAASTAAALNAERSAQKLKKVLLAARAKPLLNTTAVDAMPLKRDKAKRRAPMLGAESGADVSAAFFAGLGAGAWGPLPPFEPEFEPAGAQPATGLASRNRKQPRHAKPIQTSGPKPPPPPPPSGFSWGPVPVVQPKTTISVFTELSANRKGKAKAEDPDGLGGSWVADGFEK
ncbi:uncharacterized protein BXZ73DRAFT_40095, partial [Epithele typhae]|uniref:uncharacterized protein n=1 Tax=Epithele typhae TaxID=378194 RepID=UPI0020079469